MKKQALFFILAIVFTASVLHASGDRGKIYNASQSKSFETLQEAIDEAWPYDVIEVGPGVYPGPLLMHVEGVHLKSTKGPDHTMIIGTSEDAVGCAVVYFAADRVILEGFTVNRDDTKANSRVINPGNSDGAVIKNNILANARRGISIVWDSGDIWSNLTIEQNVFEHSIEYGIANTQNMKNMTVEGNIFRSSFEHIGLGRNFTLADDAIRNNVFLGEGKVENYTNQTFNLTRNWWGSENGPDGNVIKGQVMYRPFLLTERGLRTMRPVK